MLHTFQLNVHCKYITAHMFCVYFYKLKDKPQYTKPQMQSIFSNQRHFSPQRRSSGSVLTSRRKLSDTLLDEKRRWQVGGSLGRVFPPPGRIPTALLSATQMNRTVRCHLSQLRKKKLPFLPLALSNAGKKNEERKQDIHRGSFLRPLGWQLWQNNQHPHYFICKQW